MQFDQQMAEAIIKRRKLSANVIYNWKKSGRIPDKHFLKPKPKAKPEWLNNELANNQTKLFDFAMRLTKRNTDLSNELLQTTNYNILKLKSFNFSQSHASAYFCKILKNCFLKHVKESGKYSAIEHDTSTTMQAPATIDFETIKKPIVERWGKIGGVVFDCLAQGWENWEIVKDYNLNYNKLHHITNTIKKTLLYFEIATPSMLGRVA